MTAVVERSLFTWNLKPQQAGFFENFSKNLFSQKFAFFVNKQSTISMEKPKRKIQKKIHSQME